MQNKLYKKGLVVGIIVLFFGLAFIPSFNAIPLSTSDDNIPLPIIEVTWETYKLDSTWYVDFNCSYDDNGSGIHRVAWYLNGLEQDIITGPGPYAFHLTVKLSIVKKSVFRFVAYYGIGFSAFEEIDGSDIKSLEDCIECQSNGSLCTLYLFLRTRGYLVLMRLEMYCLVLYHNGFEKLLDIFENYVFYPHLEKLRHYEDKLVEYDCGVPPLPI